MYLSKFLYHQRHHNYLTTKIYFPPHQPCSTDIKNPEQGIPCPPHLSPARFSKRPLRCPSPPQPHYRVRLPSQKSQYAPRPYGNLAARVPTVPVLRNPGIRPSQILLLSLAHRKNIPPRAIRGLVCGVTLPALAYFSRRGCLMSRKLPALPGKLPYLEAMDR